MKHHAMVLTTTLLVLVGTFLVVLAVAAPSTDAICTQVTFGAVTQSCEVQP